VTLLSPQLLEVVERGTPSVGLSAYGRRPRLGAALFVGDAQDANASTTSTGSDPTAGNTSRNKPPS
jgi:hypothetical protein